MGGGAGPFLNQFRKCACCLLSAKYDCCLYTQKMIWWLFTFCSPVVFPFSLPTSAKYARRHRCPLLARACTNEWLPPRLQQHQNVSAGDRYPHRTWHQEALGQQQASDTAAIQRGLEQRLRHRGACGPALSVPRQGPALQTADTTQQLGRCPQVLV